MNYVWNGLQLLQIVFLHHQEAAIVFIANYLKSLYSCESLSYTSLKCFVLLVDFSELLLSVVFDNIVYIDLRSFKKSFSLVWVCVVSYFHLLTLNLHLLRSRVVYFLLFHSAWSGDWVRFLVLYSQLLVSFSSHLLNQLLLVGLISCFLYSIELELPLYCLLFSYSFGLDHLLSILYSIFLSFSSLLFLFLLLYRSCLFD